MDVHRARFVPYPVSAISAVAFSRSAESASTTFGPQPALKLAIGRQNGRIEIWNPLQGRWVQERVFTEHENQSIDGLAWTREADDKDAGGNLVLGQYRLFSISGSPAVTEWDLARGVPRRQSSGNFSEVWCFAAQPRAVVSNLKLDESAPSQDIVVGCADGTLVLLSTADNELEFKRILARASGRKTRCLSVTYQNRDRVVAGFTNGTIRIYDTKKDTCVRTMSLGASLPGAPKNIYVWQVRCLPNGDIVSGDSSGNITLWDGRTYSSSQRIVAHETDCLDIATSADGKTIFSGSIEGRVAVIRSTPGLSGRTMWTKQSHRRLHNGEIKCLAAVDTDDLSVIVSGGGDMKAVVTPLREYGKTASLTLPHLPQNGTVASARQARLLVSWWDKTISIWRISRRPGVDPEPQPPRKLVAKMTLNTTHNLDSVCISNDGRALAASTRSETKVFHLRRRPEDETLAIKKLKIPRELAISPSRIMSFSPDGKWLAAVTQDNDVQVVRLTAEPENPKRLRVLGSVVDLDRQDRRVEKQTGYARYDRTVVRMAFSADSSVLVVGDASGYLDSWVLEGHEDLTAPAVDLATAGDTAMTNGRADSDSDSSDDEEVAVFYGQHWTDNPKGHLLPKLESMPLVLSFRPVSADHQVNGNPGVHATRHNPHAHSHELPSGQHRLWVMTAQHQMYEFDVLAGHSSEWSRRNPTAALPGEFRKLRDRVIGALWDLTTSRERLWLYGSSWMFMLDVTGDLATDTNAGISSTSALGKKRRGAASDAQDSGKRRRLSQSSSRPANLLHHREGLTGTAKRYDDGNMTSVDLDRLPSSTTIRRRSVTDSNANEEGEAEDEATSAELLRLARRSSAPKSEDHILATASSSSSSSRAAWLTLKYRSILGVVPLDDPTSLTVSSAMTETNGLHNGQKERDGADRDENNEEEEGGLAFAPEVVVVERPVELA